MQFEDEKGLDKYKFVQLKILCSILLMILNTEKLNFVLGMEYFAKCSLFLKKGWTKF